MKSLNGQKKTQNLSLHNGNLDSKRSKLKKEKKSLKNKMQKKNRKGESWEIENYKKKPIKLNECMFEYGILSSKRDKLTPKKKNTHYT